MSDCKPPAGPRTHTPTAGLVLIAIASFVLALSGLVHWPLGEFEVRAQTAEGQAGKRARSKSSRPGTAQPGKAEPDSLPPPVAEMRDQMLAAVRSGRIEDLRPALDWNELPPVVAREAIADPIAYWRRLSPDGEGKDVLAALGQLLSTPPAALPIGRDLENSRTYVWPAYADRPLATLSPAEQADLARLVGPNAARTMIDQGRYTGWKLVIGADGTWHSFARDD